MSTTPHVDDLERLAVPAGELGRMLGIAERSVWKRLAAGQLPRPLSFGRSRRWSVAEIRDWLAAGAPDRETWETIREGRDR